VGVELGLLHGVAGRQEKGWMEESKAKGTVPMRMAGEYRGPRDDFFCWKFQIWYPSEDCVYRHANKTHRVCGGCFQGRMNLRYTEKGIQPPVVVPVQAEKSA
jgi:hypothetical protein